MIDKDLEPPVEFPGYEIYLNLRGIPNIDRLRDFTAGIHDALYSTGSVDELESCLEELCHELGVVFTPNERKIVRKENV